MRHEAFHSTWLERDRDLTIYLPARFDVLSGAARGCLILHDGQNLFDPERAHSPGHHWRVAETADHLIETGRIPPIVIAGIDHAREYRIHEYTPTAGPEPGAGLATRHARFVVDELLPFLRGTYGISNDASSIGLGGSSMGGLATLYVASVEPRTFGRLLVMSPSVWWDRRVILRQLLRCPLEGRPRVWIDVGAEEGVRAVEDARRLAQLVKRQAEVRYIEDPDAGHHEDSWAARLGDALEFLFGDAPITGRAC